MDIFLLNQEINFLRTSVRNCTILVAKII